MMRSLFLIVALVGLFFIEFYAAAKFKSPSRSRGRGDRNPSAIPDDIYDAMIKLAKGKSLPQVKERSRAEKSASVQYRRSKGEISLRRENGKVVLYLKGRRILRNSEITKIVADEFHRMKGPGARKLVYSLKENFVGLSQNKIQDILNRDKSHYRRNARFLNKATLKPIRARDVQVRHQIDLMDMGKKGTVTANGISYRYVLSVMDVFSRFVWLRALSDKCSKAICNELKIFYLEHGPPLVIQSDQGREFKGAVKKLCRDMKIKTIYSHPYHPQSQGKVERSHRSLREKMTYDFLRMSKKGVNWMKELPIYQRVLNEEPKEVLKYKSAFQVYYARKPVSSKTDVMNDELLTNAGKGHSEADRRRHSKNASTIRKDARAATERCNRRIVNAQLKCNPASKYRIGEKVYIRLPKKGGSKGGQKRCHVIEALTEKRNLKRHSYKVSFVSPLNGKMEKKWLMVDDITSLTLKEEKMKQMATKLTKQKKEYHRSRYLIPMKQDDYSEIIEDQGYYIVFNPLGDGNCQFAALANQMSALGIFRSQETLRKEIVQYLEENALDVDGFPLLELVPEFNSWEDYLQYMARSNTFGDQLTLYAAANLFNINIHVISTLGPGAGHTFHPISSYAMGTVHLGHFAENHGEHYVSLVPWLQSNEYVDNNINENVTDREVVNDVIEDDVLLDHDDEHQDDNFASQEQETNAQQFLNNDVLEIIIKLLLFSFPFMRNNLKAVNRFFRATVDREPFPIIYIPELPAEPTTISVRSIIKLKGKRSGAVIRLKEIINSPKWHVAWLKLRPQSYGWFAITDIH